MRARLAADFERFGRELPREWAAHVRDAYRVDLRARYLGVELPHPIGKASGQLSLKQEQLEADATAGLAFVVLKTVIAEDDRGTRQMAAWATHETRMTVERRRARDGRDGWTVTWKGRGWDRSLADYCALVRTGREIAKGGGPLCVPSAKYHLPPLGEPFAEAEYRHTTSALADAWGAPPLLLEFDFSPTLAGDRLADERGQILRWIEEVPRQLRATDVNLRVALKLMNARFDDAFQQEMLRVGLGSDADALVVFNRLWDAERRVAYGGWDLSDRNLRVLASRAGDGRIPLIATGNVTTGRTLLDYARQGAESAELHTFFQLPLGEYPATHGSRTQRALHALVFDPTDGLIAGMLDLEGQAIIPRRGGELHFMDVAAGTSRNPSS